MKAKWSSDLQHSILVLTVLVKQSERLDSINCLVMLSPKHLYDSPDCILSIALVANKYLTLFYLYSATKRWLRVIWTAMELLETILLWSSKWLIRKRIIRFDLVWFGLVLWQINHCRLLMPNPFLNIWRVVIYWPSTEPSIKRCTCVNKRGNSGSRWMSDNYITRFRRRLGSVPVAVGVSWGQVWELAADRGLWALSDPRLRSPARMQKKCCYGQENLFL